jgi:Ca-activated chloride channel homolog
MGFLWPSLLILLISIPLLIAFYIWILRRRKRFTIHYSSLSLIRAALPKRSTWRQHLPFALFLIAMTSLLLGMARPVASIRVPSNQATILLALDVSWSMCSSDIPPNRLTVAQAAAENFINNLEVGTRIGIIAFAGFAELIVPPTTDRAELLNAVRNLVTARRTAIGSAILRSIDAIAEVNPEVAPVHVFTEAENGQPLTVPEGFYQPDIIVLLTDGASNRGALPLDAAQLAADRGIRTYTIGFGTPQGSPFNCTPKQMGGFEFGEGFGNFGGGFGGGGFGGGGGFRRGLDEQTLREVAALTGGEYYLAESADELLEVFADVPSHLTTTRINTEISAFFAAAAAILALAAVGLSLRWNPFP